MGYNINKYDQQKEITPLREEFSEYVQIAYHVLQNVVHRIDNAYIRFYNGNGYPKFKKSSEYSSITYTNIAGWKIKNGKLKLSKCGMIKVKWSRDIKGNIKTVTIKRTKSRKWFVCFSCDNVPQKNTQILVKKLE